MPRAGKEAETPDPGSIHVNTHCTTAQLCNYSAETKTDTKNTPTIAALMSLPPLWRHLCCSCQGKGNLYSVSSCVKETKRLKDIFCCALFVCPMLTIQKERMPKSHMLHHSLGPFHTHPPWPWSTLVSKWRVHVPGPSLFMFGTFCQNCIGVLFPEAHNLSLHTRITSKCSFSIWSNQKSDLPKVNNFQNFRHTKVWDPPDWELCSYLSRRNGSRLFGYKIATTSQNFWK